MTENEIREGLAYVEAELRALDATAGDDALSAEDQERFDAGLAYVAETRSELRKIEERKAEIRRLAENPTNVEPAVPNVNTRGAEDPFDVSEITVATPKSDIRARALTAVERMDEVDDSVRQAATRTVERCFDPAGTVGLRLLATGSEAYRSAFQKVVESRGYALTADESHALERAASLTNASGGFAVPFTLDPTIIMTNDGTANPVHQVARVVQINTDQWNGVSTAGVTASWDGEAGEVSDDAPTLAQPSIDVEKAQAFVPFSIEIGQDWPGFESDMRMLFTDAKDRLEGTAFINGAGPGSNQPTGIITELDGGSSEVSPATAEVFAKGDVYSTLSELPARYRSSTARRAWIAHLGTILDIRQFVDEGEYASGLAAGTPDQLLGVDLLESSDMDDSNDIDATATADNHVLVVGDWNNYVVVDRIGLQVELVPHLFATGNNRPSGQRGLYAYWRVGAGSVNDSAFRVLNVATTA